MLLFNYDVTGMLESAALCEQRRQREGAAAAPFRAAIDFFRLDAERRCAPAGAANTSRDEACLNSQASVDSAVPRPALSPGSDVLPVSA